jgi:serine/threonine-protein kinase
MFGRGSISAPIEGLNSPRPLVDLNHIGRFEIEALIGRGGMSDVYRAFDPQLGRRVAVKVLPPTLGRNTEFTERFIRESRAAAALHHPHIVPIYEAGADGDTLFIAMLLVEGADLKSYLEERGPLNRDELRSVIGQAAGALDHAHDGGLLHRDVKPANLLLDRSGAAPHVYLSDFGLTKSIGTDSKITQTGDLIGSINYMSPEHIQGRALDRRSDVYSLGCVLYECLTGRPPFERESDIAVLYAHLNDEIPRPSKTNRHIPDVVDRVLARAMAKETRDRFASCGDLSVSLEAALEGISINLPASVKAERKPVRAKLKGALAGVAAILALAGSTVAVFHDWSSPRGLNLSNVSQDGSSASDAGRDRATSPKKSGRVASRQPRIGNDSGHPSGPRTAADGSSAPFASDGSSDVTPIAAQATGAGLRFTRSVRRNYDLRSSELRGLNNDCSQSGSVVNCVSITLTSTEKFIDIVIKDDSGLPVGAFVGQDLDQDGDWDGRWRAVCGSTPQPLRVTPGALVQVLLDGEGCGGDGSTSTAGVIVAKLFREST